MKPFWLTFEDGGQACCEGYNAEDATRIAEHLTDKTVKRPGKAPSWWSKPAPDAEPLPYPANPCIWRFDHPVHGKTPAFCFRPKECAGKNCCPCPNGRACDD